MKLSQFVGIGEQRRAPVKARPACIIRVTDKASAGWCPLLFCPEGCRPYVPLDANGLPHTAFAYVYAACEVKQLDQVRMFRLVKKYEGSFRTLDGVLLQRRCHPTDYMRAQFVAWTGGFNDKRRGKWIDCDHVPPPFMCPSHASVLSLENAEGWKRSWARLEQYVTERTPLGPLYRDPHVLLELSTKLAAVKAVNIKRLRDKHLNACSLVLVKASSQQHREIFADVRLGKLKVEHLVHSVDEKTLALLVFSGVATSTKDTTLFKDTLSFLEHTQPSYEWIEQALHPLKVPKR